MTEKNVRNTPPVETFDLYDDMQKAVQGGKQALLRYAVRALSGERELATLLAQAEKHTEEDAFALQTLSALELPDIAKINGLFQFHLVHLREGADGSDEAYRERASERHSAEICARILRLRVEAALSPVATRWKQLLTDSEEEILPSSTKKAALKNVEAARLEDPARVQSLLSTMQEWMPFAEEMCGRSDRAKRGKKFEDI